MLTRTLLALLTLGAAAFRPAPDRYRIALTFDDAPWNGHRSAGDSVGMHTAALLRTLAAHRAPAAVFVNCTDAFDAQAIVRRWARAGTIVGNHVSAHPDLHSSPTHRWADAVRSCHRMLTATLGTAPTYLRFPFLHQGSTPEQRDTVDALLRELRYRVAHVTVDNSDYLISRAYDEARARRDSQAMRRLGTAMLDHDLDAVRHFRDVARRLAGHDVSHVLLLHVNHMTVDNLDALLTRLERDGAQFISLPEALADPIYSRPDRYRGPKGLSWLYRITPAVPAEAAWDDREADRITRLIDSLSASRAARRPAG